MVEQSTLGEGEGTALVSEGGASMVLSGDETCDLSKNMGGCSAGLDKVNRIRRSEHRVKYYFFLSNS